MNRASALGALRDCGTIRARAIGCERFESLVRRGYAVRLLGSTIIRDRHGYGDYRLTPTGRALADEALAASA